MGITNKERRIVSFEIVRLNRWSEYSPTSKFNNPSLRQAGLLFVPA